YCYVGCKADELIVEKDIPTPINIPPTGLANRLKTTGKSDTK
ncbi:10482_t:CDS:1, partial [Funneliformis mosseae]